MRICSITLCLLLMWASIGLSQDVNTIIEQVQLRYEETQDIQATFLQLSLIKSAGQQKQSQGLVYFKKPGKMHWEYTAPEYQLLVSDGKTVWFYVKDDEQVIVQHAEDAYGSKTPITFLSGMGKLQNDFYIKLLPDMGNDDQLVQGYTLELLPKQPQPDVAKLILTVDPETYQIIHTGVYDPYGNITDVYLQNIRTNINPPEELFTFEIPEGVDVIQQD